MFAKKLLAVTFVAAIVVSGAAKCAATQEASSPRTAPAQESGVPKSGGSSATPGPMRAYRADFVLIELEDGKKIDSRQYSLSLNDAGQAHVQIGTRVPVGDKTDGSVQYLDVNTYIQGRLHDLPNGMVLDVDFNATSVAVDETNRGSRPVLRTLGISNGTVVALGKMTLVGTADDPNSKREFQLEVTVTEMK